MVGSCAAGPQLETGGEGDRGIKPWSCILLTTPDVTASHRPQCPQWHHQTPNPSCCLSRLWKDQGTLKSLLLVAPPGAGGSLAKIPACLHPHRSEEEQRHSVSQQQGGELLFPPGWHREGDSGAGGPGPLPHPCSPPSSKGSLNVWHGSALNGWECVTTLPCFISSQESRRKQGSTHPPSVRVIPGGHAPAPAEMVSPLRVWVPWEQLLCDWWLCSNRGGLLASSWPERGNLLPPSHARAELSPRSPP